jgi:glutamate-1-semialdehyde 2,1-aminomutase
MQGAGNERFNSDCLILEDKADASLELLRVRADEIACVIVNPISGFGWQGATTAGLSQAKISPGEECIDRFRSWLARLREACTKNGIPLIYDETWAFQLGPGGAQELYGVEPDLVVLGKSIGGGHATGVVCGPTRLMERRDPVRPMRVSFCVGTFKGNPVVMGAMNSVLKWVTSPEAAGVFNGLKDRVARWVTKCNKALSSEDIPIKVAAYRNTWCVVYEQPSPYHFLFHYYLRDAGLQMAWVGTGKMLLNLEYSEEDLERLTALIVKAAKSFKEDGWWYQGTQPSIGYLLNLVVGPSLRFHFGGLMGAGANGAH